MKEHKMGIKCGICILLLAALLCAPVAASGQAREDESAAASGEEARPSAHTNRKRGLLILGVTVVGVTGMWVTLYRRGK